MTDRNKHEYEELSWKTLKFTRIYNHGFERQWRRQSRDPPRDSSSYDSRNVYGSTCRNHLDPILFPIKGPRCLVQETREGSKRGFVFLSHVTRRTSTPSPLHPLCSNKKDVRSYTERNNSTILVYDTIE